MSHYSWKPGELKRVDVNGCGIETICFGPPPDQAPTIVLLHEGLGCITLWRDFPKALADATGHGVFSYSRAGYGRSDPVSLPRPLDYMTVEASGSLPLILDHIGFRKGVLLGHSDGASIAAIYPSVASDHRVRGLILIAPHFFTEGLQLQAISEARRQFEQGTLREKLSKYHNRADNAFYGWNDAWLDPAFASWDISDCIDYWRVPVLAIQGEQDQYGTKAQLEVIEKRAYCPVEIELIRNCQHSPQIEHLQHTLSVIRNFSQKLWQMEGA